MDNFMQNGMFDNIMQQMGVSATEDTAKQAQNIWKMLDDMAQTNPEQYNKFVSGHIKDGFSNLKEEKDKKIKDQMVTPTAQCLIKTMANLQQIKLDQNQKDIYKNLIVNAKPEDYQNFKAKLFKENKEVKIYINVLTHERVKGAHNTKGDEILKLENYKEAVNIPFSMRDAQEGISESFGYAVYFFDFVINDKLYANVTQNIKMIATFIQFVVDRVQEQLKHDRNPLLKKYNALDSNELLFYAFEKNSIMRHTKKTYKSYNKNKSKVPEPLLLLPHTDREYKEPQKTDTEQVKNIFEKPQEILSVQNQIHQQQEQQNKEKVLDGLKLVDESQKDLKQSNQKQQQKKVVIEEIVTETFKENVLEKPAYQLNETEQSITFEFLLPKVQLFKDIILDISVKQLNLSLPFVYEFVYDFKYRVDNDNLQAKWDKKAKKLKVILQRQI